MPDLIFIQRSAFGRSIFALRGDTLEITSHLFGRKKAASIPVRSISHDYVLGANRIWPLIVGYMVFAAACIGLVRLILFVEPRRAAIPDLLVGVKARQGTLI